MRVHRATFDNGPTPYAALRALDEIRSHAEGMTQSESVMLRFEGKFILDILTRHGLNDRRT